MTYSYFPGCTLKTKGKALEDYGLLAAKALGIELVELPDWQCCGAVFPDARDDFAPKLSAVRALTAARDQNQALVTLCSACHHVIKRVNFQLKTDAEVCASINQYMRLSFAHQGQSFGAPSETPEAKSVVKQSSAPQEAFVYQGETKVLHFLEVLRDEIGFDALRKKVKNPLTGKRIGAYYGCMLLRPSRELAFDDPENPTVMEQLLQALGATPVFYAMRNECCGSYVTLKDKDFSKKRADAIMENARACGLEALITACPLCIYNLREHATNPLPVYYFTELLFHALSDAEST